MATKEKKQAKKREVQEHVQVEHTGKGLPVPPPRLRTYFENTVRERLKSQFGFTNVHQIPTLEKIVINCVRGQASKHCKTLDTVVNGHGILTGQRAVKQKAKKSIANFGLREGQDIGASVTLRGARMWEFLDRFATIALPRIRDFRGLNTRSFDGRGNYTMGVKEQMIFPRSEEHTSELQSPCYL